MHGMNNVLNCYMLRITYCWRLTRTAFILTVMSQGKPDWWMLMRSNRSLDCSAVVSCVCKKILSFYLVPCSSERSTQFKLGLLLTEKRNNCNQLKTIDAVIQHNVLARNYKFSQQDYPGKNVRYPRCQGQSCSPHSRTVNSFLPAYVYL